MHADVVRREISWDAATATLTVGTRAKVVACAPGDNECILQTFVSLVAMQRRVRKGADLDLRRDDIVVLAELLDLDDADLQARLARILFFDADEAADVHRLLLLAAAATVGAGLLVTSALPVAAAERPAVAADKAIRSDFAVPAAAPGDPVTVTVSVAPEVDVDDSVVYERPAEDPAPGPEVEIGDALVIERTLP